MEVFSPPRVAQFAQRAGIPCLGSFDKEGGWDFTRKGDRDKNAYAHQEITEVQRQRDAETLLLLGFAMEIAMVQVEGGRKFAFEHPS
eukprot:3528752-Pyramimonas_sp.AAC.1